MKYSALKRMSLDEIKQVELDLLIEFDKFCNANGLLYTLEAGTLLGAIRHEGFIPWDDDIDVSMPYPDYLEFIRLWEQHNKNQSLDLFYDMKNHAGLTFIKLVDKRTIINSAVRDDKHSFPVWIDIFPMYAIDDDDQIALKDISDVLKLREHSWRFINYHSQNLLKKSFKYIAGDFLLARDIKKMKKVCNKHPYGTTKRIRIVPVSSNKLCWTTIEHFNRREKRQFENHLFWCPEDYDSYLTRVYGDYMTLPPENERITHNIEAYWR